MSQAQRSVPIDLGFSVADASSPAVQFDGQALTVKFSEWTERTVTLKCFDVIGVRWQEAEWSVDEADRYDSTCLVENSEWLNEHHRQGVLFGDKPFRHLKLNFNAAGVLEVLCTDASAAESSFERR